MRSTTPTPGITARLMLPTSFAVNSLSLGSSKLFTILSLAGLIGITPVIDEKTRPHKGPGRYYGDVHVA